MSDLPPIRRLLVEDFATQKSWISPLLLIFNSFTEAVVNTLTSGVTVKDNTTGDILTMTLSGTLPVSVVWTKKLPPSVVVVGNISRLDGAAITLSAAVGITWGMSGDGKSLQVLSIVGVTPSTTIKYKLTLLCFQG